MENFDNIYKQPIEYIYVIKGENQNEVICGKGESIDEIKKNGKVYKIQRGKINLPKLFGNQKYIIENQAFENTSLSSFDFSDVAKIGEWAFSNTKLKEIETSNVRFSDYAFDFCEELKKVTCWGKKSGIIPMGLFNDCQELEEVDFEECREIHRYALLNTKIKNLSFPETLRFFDLASLIGAEIETLKFNSKVSVRYEEKPIDTCIYPYKNMHLSQEAWLSLIEQEPNLYFKLPNEFFVNNEKFLHKCNKIICAYFLNKTGKTKDLKNEFMKFKGNMDLKKKIAKDKLLNENEKNLEIEKLIQKRLGLTDEEIKEVTTSKTAKTSNKKTVKTPKTK